MEASDAIPQMEAPSVGGELRGKRHEKMLRERLAAARHTIYTMKLRIYSYFCSE